MRASIPCVHGNLSFYLLVNLDIYLRKSETDGWSLDERLSVQRAREGPAIIAPGRLFMDRFSAWHSGPGTSRSMASIFLKLPHRGDSSDWLWILKTMLYFWNRFEWWSLLSLLAGCSVQSIHSYRPYQVWGAGASQPLPVEGRTQLCSSNQSACFWILCPQTGAPMFRERRERAWAWRDRTWVLSLPFPSSLLTLGNVT